MVKMVRPGLWLFRVVYCGFSLLGYDGFICVFYLYGSIKMWPHKSSFVAVVNHAIVPNFRATLHGGYHLVLTNSLPWKIHPFLI